MGTSDAHAKYSSGGELMGIPQIIRRSTVPLIADASKIAVFMGE